MIAQTRLVNRLTHEVSVATDAWRQLARRARQELLAAGPSGRVVGLLVLAILVAPLIYHFLPLIVPPWWGGTEDYCKSHALGCDLGTHILGDALLALIGVALFLRRETRTVSRWRSRAQKNPEQLFTWLGPVAEGLTGIAADTAAASNRVTARLRRPRAPSHIVSGIVGRRNLVREIADDLESGCEPQVLVADSAAGKTMVLVKLADHLARRGQLPVAISLQGSTNLDFERLAREAFGRHSEAADEEDLDKQWRALLRQRRITVIADDLEKAYAEPYQRVAALKAAAEQRLRLVAASRPYAMPPRFTGRIDLEPLNDVEVKRDLAQKVRRAASSSERPQQDPDAAVAQIVSRAELTSTPYYLSLARVLAKHDLLRTPPKDFDTRLWLMSTYRDALRATVVRPDAGLTEPSRAAALKGLEAIAYVRLHGVSEIDALARNVAAVGGSYDGVFSVLEMAEKLGVITSSHEREVRFAQPTTQAYFASCYLLDHRGDDERRFWKSLMDQVWSPFRALAVSFATTSAGDTDLTRYVCRYLLAREDTDPAASSQRSDAASSWLGTAAEIVHRGAPIDKQTAVEVLNNVERRLTSTTRPGREQAGLVMALGSLCEKLQIPEAYETLFAYATGPAEYAFRRQATKALTQGKSALDALAPAIAEVMSHADRYARRLTEPAADDDGEPFKSLKAVAWVLPSLGDASGAGETRQDVERYQRRLITYAGLETRPPELGRHGRRLLPQNLSDQRGLEASVAQGFKVAALRAPDLPPDRLAMDMLRAGKGRARFWFSRALLVQALARRCMGKREGEAYRLMVAALRDEHVFVRRTAKLSLEALIDDQPERLLFDDITDVAGRAPYDLAPAASQLVADIVLALNLNEYGDADARRAFGHESRLPVCLSHTRNREAVVSYDAKRRDCPFAPYRVDKPCLCPYTSDPPPHSNRRELSRAFCRHQRLNARRLPWHRRVGTRELRRFWAMMENLARY